MTVCYATLPTSLIRHIWEIIEQTQSHLLLSLNDQEMIRQLLSQVQHQQSMNGQEIQGLRNYLIARTSLIRDIASDRRGVVYS